MPSKKEKIKKFEKSVYITGVAGLIGSNLAKVLLRKGYTVKGCDSLIGGYQSNIPKNIVWDNIDILDLDKLTESMEGCDIVVHCAALAHEGLSVFSPSTITKNIYSGSVSVMSSAIQNGYSKFINCSSMARYGNIQVPFREKDECHPIDPYGMAKLNAEHQLSLLSEIHDIKLYTVVPHNVIGIGQVYTDPYRNVAAIFTNRLLQGKDIIIYGDGQQKRSFTDVEDAVIPIIKLIEDDSFPNCFLFNIGPTDGSEITILELAYLVANTCKIYPRITYMPDRPREVKNAWVDSYLASSMLNYTSTIPVNKTIEKLVGWITSRGHQPFDYYLPLEIVNESTPKTWAKKLL